MAQFVLPASDAFRNAPAHAVYTRGHWADEWTVRPGLYCSMARWGSGSARPEAELLWTYAEVMLPGESAYTYRAPLDLLGHFVKIQIDQPAPDDPLRWYGIISDEARQRAGAIEIPGVGRRQTGTQILSAEGIDLLLMREIMFSSHVRSSSGQDQTIRRGLTFNGPLAAGDPTNRSNQRLLSPAGGEAYAFAPDIWNAEPWSTKTILEYLLAFHAPRASIDWPINWRLSDGARLVCPDWDAPVVATHGRDLRSIINQLCTPQKGLSWQLLLDAGGPAPNVLLDVFSFLPSPIELPSGLTQPGNQDLIELGDNALDLDSAVDPQVSLRHSDHQRVDQIVVRGARKRVVASFSHADGTFGPDWDPNDEADYQSGPGGLSGLDISEAQQLLREYRATDRLQRVYAYYRVPVGWNGEVGAGEGPWVHPLSFCAPPMWPAGDEISGTAESFYLPEFRFDRSLPKELDESAPESSPPGLRAPFGVIQTRIGAGPGYHGYTYLDRLAITSDIEGSGDGSGRDWSASLRVQTDAPGVILKVSGGPQHLLAKTDFTPLPDLDEEGQLHWYEIIITAMFELDSQVEARWPPDAQLDAEADTIRRVYIDVGEKARLDWVHLGAVLDLDANGRPVYLNGSTPGTDGQYVRDDRSEMQDLARLMFAWYATPRQAFSLLLRQITGILSVGQLITRIGSGDAATAVNACVTGVEIDLLAVTTQISTQFAELDAMNFLGRTGESFPTHVPNYVSQSLVPNLPSSHGSH